MCGRAHGHVSARAMYTHYNGLLVCTGRAREREREGREGEDLRTSLARRKKIFVVPAALIETFFLSFFLFPFPIYLCVFPFPVRGYFLVYEVTGPGNSNLVANKLG